MEDNVCDCDNFPGIHNFDALRCDDREICSQCKKRCNVVDIDFGIGGHDYGGVWSVDSDVQTVSDCCHQLVEDC